MISPGIQGLRAVAALSVVTAHGWDNALKDLGWFNGSHLVVEFFFVLSGFLVTKVYAERVQCSRDCAALIVKRLGRLYPIHIFALLGWLAFFYAKQLAGILLPMAGIDLNFTPPSEQAGFDLGYFMLNVSMLHGIGIQDSMHYNFPAWSISAEFWAFVIVIGIFGITGSRQQRINRAILGLSLCTVHYLLIWWLHGVPDERNTPAMFKVVSRAASAYFIGSLAYEYCRANSIRLTAIAHSSIQIVCVVAIVLIASNQQWLIFAQFGGSVVWAVMIISLTSGYGVVNATLSGRFLVWLGERSYSLYITHALVLLVYANKVRAIDDVWLSTAMLIPYYLTAILVAWLAHRYVEQPCYGPVKNLAQRIQQGSSARYTAGPQT